MNETCNKKTRILSISYDQGDDVQFIMVDEEIIYNWSLKGNIYFLNNFCLQSKQGWMMHQNGLSFAIGYENRE
jgi:hypothetical protein